MNLVIATVLYAVHLMGFGIVQTKPHCGLGIRVCVAGYRNEDAM
jgi:hypothetical protein